MRFPIIVGAVIVAFWVAVFAYCFGRNPPAPVTPAVYDHHEVYRPAVDRALVESAAKRFFVELDPEDGPNVRARCSFRSETPTCWGAYGNLFLVLDCSEDECVPRPGR